MVRSGDIFACYNWQKGEVPLLSKWVQAGDTIQHPILPTCAQVETAPQLMFSKLNWLIRAVLTILYV